MHSNRIADETRTADISIGARVEVRNAAQRTWTRGFRIAALICDAYLVRRVSDGAVLPRSFAPEDVRPC